MLIGSVHVKVDGSMTAKELEHMQRRVTEHVLKEHGVLITGFGIYADDQNSDDMFDRILELALKHEGVLQVHGFFLDDLSRKAWFKLVLDYALKNRHEVYQAVCSDMQTAFPEYTIQIIMDIDF